MKKLWIVVLSALLIFALSACASQESTSSTESTAGTANTENKGSSPTDSVTQEEDEVSKDTKRKELGGLSPEEALKYMKATENLVIVDVATTSWYDKEHFGGAIHIPIEELDSDEEDALYMEIPAGRPVILHCRLGMVVPGAYQRVLELRSDIPEIAYIDGKPLFAEYNEWKSQQSNAASEPVHMGGIEPAEALELMKTMEDLVIVEVNAPEWKLKTGFIGAMYIPYTEMAEHYNEIPKKRPVLLHCGGGIVSVEAYETLLEKRPDIPWLGYIAGAPLVSAYNEWAAQQ